jgi:membrane associated rhomboid family serine protease
MSFNRPSSLGYLPPVVKNLIIINVLFFIATLLAESKFGFDLSDLLGMHFPGSEKFQFFQLLTYLFMHGNFQHIFFNMLAVWMFGSVLENYWGSKKFLIFYLITGIGAAFTHYVVLYYDQIRPMLNAVESYIANPDINAFKDFVISERLNPLILNEINNLVSSGNVSEALTLSTEYANMYRTEALNAPNVVGASGSVFGLLLAYGMLFPNQIIYLYFAIPIKAKYFVMLYGAIELYSGLSGAQSGIAHFAHLGGMLFGFILIKWWNTQKNDFY